MRNGFEKVFMGAAGSAGGGGLDITDLFSTYLYAGDGTNGRQINNGIDLSGEGGMVWFKARTTGQNHRMFDTERGSDYSMTPNATSRQSDHGSTGLNSFDNDGFTLGAAVANGSGIYGGDYASWTWRKAPKYFDIVTYTGSGSAKTVAHSLGSAPGMIIIKNRDVTDPWAVYHRANTAAPQTDYLVLNTTAATVDSAAWWNDTAPTSSVFTVGTDHSVNANGENYVAYLFAHNDGDGGFGPDGDQDIIKCGSYTGNGSSSGLEIDLGFEPQWVLVKGASSGAAYDWFIWDTMRGMDVSRSGPWLRPNLANGEGSNTGLALGVTSTGFNAGNDTNTNGNGETYIYMAIRRGPLAVPEAATEVFAVSTPSTPVFVSGFAVDMVIDTLKISQGNHISARLTGDEYMVTNDDNAGGGRDFNFFDDNGGLDLGTNWYGTNQAGSIAWMWKRAPSFFDVVCYTGTGANRTISHNLNAAPDMIWLKARETVSSNNDWLIYSSAFADPTDTVTALNVVGGGSTGSGTILWNDTAPTDSVFSLGNYNGINQSGKDYIAFLFATLAGISKVGSVTHSGTTNVDCGFASGSRFVLLKRIDANSDWYVWDSVNGIVSGNDPYIQLNASAAQVTGSDFIDPLNAGFTISDNFTDGDYIFYAIA